MNNALIGKTMENVRNHRDIKLVSTNKRRSMSASESNYHTTKHFSEKLLSIEMYRTNAPMNKPVYLGMQILDMSKIVMYDYYYINAKLKYGKIVTATGLEPATA